jgi:hypothetical protein
MRILLVTVALLAAFPGAANAADVLINNGLDCSNPGNVIDDDTYQDDTVYVRNVGCGTPNPDSSCPSPGAATEVCLVDGGEVDYLHVYDSSTVTMSGGSTHWLDAYGSSTVTMIGGTVWDLFARDISNIAMSGGEVWLLHAHGSSTFAMSGGRVSRSFLAFNSSTVTMSGGAAWGLSARDISDITMSGGTVDRLLASDSSTITIVGSGFEVFGVPVAYGDLTALFGELTGTLASGDPINSSFSRGSLEDRPPVPGTIALIPSLVIDVRPGDRENEIPGRRGVPIQVAILGSAGLDVRDVDVTTLRFGPGAASPALDLAHPFTYRLSLRDVNGDGEDDLVPVFLYGDTELPLGESEACLTGEIASASFEACDTVLVFLPECGRGFELALLLPPLMWLRWRGRLESRSASGTSRELEQSAAMRSASS